jgi:hypothetical protein
MSSDSKASMATSEPKWSLVDCNLPPEFCNRAYEQLSAVTFVDAIHRLQIDGPSFQFFSEPAGLDYRYFKTPVKGQAFPSVLTELREISRKLCPEVPFDVAFVNHYVGGDIHIPKHRDSTHGCEFPILSFSFYPAEAKASDWRQLDIYTKEQSDKPVASLVMNNGSAVVMRVGMQSSHLHSVPKSSTAKTGRINVTFRVHSSLL